MFIKALIKSLPFIVPITLITILGYLFLFDKYPQLSIFIPLAIFILTFVKRQKDLEDQKKENKKLKETRFIGFYPNYFDEVIQILGEAKRSILITTPVLATGFTTANEKWKKYRNTINQKEGDGIAITFVCYDKSRRLEYSLEKYGEKSFKKNNDHLNDINISSKNNNNSPYLFNILNILESAHKEAYDTIFKDLKIHQTNQHIGIYSWVVDYPESPQAVFVIPSNIRTDVENSEVAFRTKDSRLIEALVKISDRLSIDEISQNIRPLNSIVYEGADYISQTAVDFVNETGVIYSLGTIDALQHSKDAPYLLATRRFINEDENCYFRVGNFSLTVGNYEELKKLKNNVSFFLNLLELGVKNVEIYHNPEVAKGVDDFHFRINQNKVVIRIGAKITKSMSAIVIPDKGVRESFLAHYKNMLANPSSKLLTIKRLKKLSALLNQTSSKGVTDDLAEISSKVSKYLENLPIRLSFNNRLSKEDILVEISDVTNLNASELFDFIKIYNRYGVVILSLQNSKNLGKYYEEGGLIQLDMEMKSLSRFFGQLYVHERSNEHRVDIKYGGNDNSPYMGTTAEPYPPHSDGIYDENPPAVVTLFSYEPCRKGTGETILISGKAIYDEISSSHNKNVIEELFKTEIEFERKGKKTAKTIFVSEFKNTIQINYRNDRQVKIEKKEGSEIFEALNTIDRFIDDPRNSLSIYLEKGQILVMDNRAVLHGRKEFKDTGRWLCRYSFMGKGKQKGKFISGFPPQTTH